MTPGILVFGLPVLLVALFCWRKFLRTGDFGSSMVIFLPGYTIWFALQGAYHSLLQLSESSIASDYIWFLFSSAIGGFLVGWAALAVSWVAVENFGPVILSRTDSEMLLLARTQSSRTGELTRYRANPDATVSAEHTRQLTIEECAEEVYNYFIENEAWHVTDNDLAEAIASSLRASMLALGGKGSVR